MTLDFETGEHWLDADVPMISVAGELDLATRDEVASRLTELASTEPALIIDLRRCTFLDSSALAMIAKVHQNLATRNGDATPLALLVDSPQISRILELAGLDHVLPIFADEEAALAALKASRS